MSYIGRLLAIVLDSRHMTTLWYLIVNYSHLLSWFLISLNIHLHSTAIPTNLVEEEYNVAKAVVKTPPSNRIGYTALGFLL